MQALAGFDVEYRLVQRAFHLAIFDKALAQQRIGVRTYVFQRVIFTINQINADLFTVDVAAKGKSSCTCSASHTPIQLITILQAFVSYMKLCFLFNTVNIKAMNVSSSANVTNLLTRR
jgi:hypothetical protein